MKYKNFRLTKAVLIRREGRALIALDLLTGKQTIEVNPLDTAVILKLVKDGTKPCPN